MQRATSIEFQRHPDSQLWLAAFALAVITTLAVAALLAIAIQKMDWSLAIEPRPKAEEETVATLYLQPMSERADESSPAKPLEKPFARTSADQPESTEKTNERIGERSTRATSDRPADPNADALPSQRGIEPRDGEIETTESQYQDGELIPPTPDSPAAEGEPAAPLAQASQLPRPLESNKPSDTPPIDTSEPTVSEERSLPPPRETLLEGPESVEVNVPLEEGDSERPRETPQHQAQESAVDTQPPTEQQTSNPPSPITSQPKEKAFQGFQRKTAMVGSISRTGRSALNVDDSELGRYHAAIARAVELEWQRNCLRHRDFITPGFLTVRFYIEPSGRVRSVNFVGDMETGEVQKGFTLSSIREAAIPKMPATLAQAYEGETMELVFRFYF